MTQLNRTAYERLIQENIEWVEKHATDGTGPSTEAGHIISVLRNSVIRLYPPKEEAGVAMTREQAYDAKINPLMAQIIDTCYRYKIPVVAYFGLQSPADENLVVSTVILKDDHMEGMGKVGRDNMFTAKSILIEGFIAWARRQR